MRTLMERTSVGFRSIDEYIATFPNEIQELLEALRATIRASAPDAEERISYQFPNSFLKAIWFILLRSRSILDFIRHQVGLRHSRMNYQGIKAQKALSNSP